MANGYYNQIHFYLPRTKAQGEHVREDLNAVETGFEKLPHHNNQGTGFTEAFVVADPISGQSPVPRHFMETWVKDYVARYIDEQLQPDVPDGGLLWSAPPATEGQTVINPPYKFTMASVYINGVMQDRMRGSYTIGNNQIFLSQPLEVGDEVAVVIGYPRPESPQGEWTMVTDDYEALPGEKILLDSTSKPFGVMLPALPMPGSQVFFLEVGGAVGSNTVTLWGNGETIMGADSLVIRIENISLSVLFVNGYGWRVIE